MKNMIGVAIADNHDPEDRADHFGLLLSAVDAAKFLGISKRQMFRLDAAAAIPRSVRVGISNRRFWRRDDLALWVEAGCPMCEQWEEQYSRNDT